MSLIGKKLYVQKPVSGKLYTWSPESSVTNNIKGPNQSKEFCNATPHSVNTEDTITNYVSDTIVENGIVKQIAYVECGYVE